MPTLEDYAQALKNYGSKLDQYLTPKTAAKPPEKVKAADLTPAPSPKLTPVERVLPVTESLPDAFDTVKIVAEEKELPAVIPELEEQLMAGFRAEFKKAVDGYRQVYNEDPPLYAEALEWIARPTSRIPGATCQRGFTAVQCAALKDPFLWRVHFTYNIIIIWTNRIRGLKEWKKMQEGQPCNLPIYPQTLLDYRLLGMKAPYEK